MVWNLGVLVYGLMSLSLAIILYLIDYRETQISSYITFISISILLMIAGVVGYLGLYAKNLSEAKLYFKMFTLLTVGGFSGFYLIIRKGIYKKMRKIIDEVFLFLTALLMYDSIFYQSKIKRVNDLFFLVRDNSYLGLIVAGINSIMVFSLLTYVLIKIHDKTIIKFRKKLTRYLIIISSAIIPTYFVIKLWGGVSLSLTITLYLFISVFWLISALLVQMDPYIYLFSPNTLTGIAIIYLDNGYEFKHFLDKESKELIDKGLTFAISKFRNSSNDYYLLKSSSRSLAVVGSESLIIILVGFDISKDILKIMKKTIKEISNLVMKMPEEFLHSSIYMQAEEIVKKLF